MVYKINLLNNNYKFNIDSQEIFKKIFKKIKIPYYITNILNDISYVNGKLQFTKNNFTIYPIGNNKINNLEISLIKDFTENDFSEIESSVLGQLGKFEMITNNTYILSKEETFIESSLYNNINNNKYQGIKINYTPNFLKNFTINSFYGIENDIDISDFINSQKIFSYGITFRKQFKNFGTTIFDYFKYPEFDNYYISNSSLNTFFIYDYFVNDNDHHYSFFSEVVIYKSNNNSCPLKNQKLTIFGGILYDDKNRQILPALSIYNSKIGNIKLNILRSLDSSYKFNLNLSQNNSFVKKSNDKSINLFNCSYY